MCTGRHARRTNCERKSMFVPDIEAAVEDYYRHVQIPEHVVTALRELVTSEFDRLHQVAKHEAQGYKAERDALRDERTKLMQAHYAGAVPLDLLGTEQDRIARRLAFLDAQINAGGGITLAAAKAIVDSGRRHARTIRVILYGSEEVAQPTRETGNGGGVYARNQGAALDKHIIAGESDFGADRVYALRLPAGAQGSDFQKAANRVLYPIGVLASQQVETSGGVDIGPMGPMGVPFFGLAQDGTRYFDLHHTANDTLDKIDPAQLSQNVAAWAGLVWLIADSDVDFRAMRPAGAPGSTGR